MVSRKGTRRACDPCSVRKVRCDGIQPCSRCKASSWDCTYLRAHGKSGPKGPRRTTEAAIRRLQQRSRTDLESTTKGESDVDYESPSTVDSLPTTNGSSFETMRWQDSASPPFSGSCTRPQRIPASVISRYLDIYQTHGYAVWPVVNAETLLTRLLEHPEDIGAYGAATAICAATASQFRIEDELQSPVDGHFRISCGLFESEAKRAREDLDHLEQVTIWSLLSAFFLHVYSVNTGRIATSTVLLGEAITKAHIIGLHKLTYYQGLDFEQLQHDLRIYWLLFITERSHSIQHNVPTMLRRAPNLPPLENMNDSTTTPAFIQLCRLFNILDNTLTADPVAARNALTLAQQQLGDIEASCNLKNELRKTGVSPTQQWMHIVLWQHALGITSIRSTIKDTEFSFALPMTIVQNTLGFLGSLPNDILEVIGPRMESKLFDIAHSLADIMIHVPNLNANSGLDIGLRDLIHSLLTLLSNCHGGNPTVINILHDKLATIGITVPSPGGPIELSSTNNTQEEWRQETPRSLAWNESTIYSPIAPLSPVVSTEIQFW